MFTALVVFAVVKGARMPGQWAMTHYLFTYQAGFMKRALWGELLRRALGDWTANYFCLAAVAFIVLGFLLGLVWIACRRLEMSPETTQFLLVFAASPALAFMVHLVGYLEEIGYLAVMVGVLLRRRWWWQAGWCVFAAAALPLVHEGSIVWVGSLIGLTVAAGAGAPSRRVAALLLVAVVWAASTAAVIRYGRVSRPHLEAIRTDRIAMAGFHLRPDAFDTLRTPLREQMQGMGMWWSNPDRRLEFWSSLLVFGPAALLLGAIAVRRGRRLEGGGGLRAIAIALTLAGVAAPLVLNAIAMDLHRWDAIGAFNAGLAALILIEAVPAAAERARGGRRLALAMIVALWSAASQPIFFDGYDPAHPPFSSQIRFLIDAIQTPNRDMWMPRN